MKIVDVILLICGMSLLLIELSIIGSNPEAERAVCYSFIGITITSWCTHSWKLFFDKWRPVDDNRSHEVK